jgi:phage tail protein X
VHSDIIHSLVDQSGNAVTVNDFLLAEEISVEEVCNAVNTVKKGKASGVDNIQVDVFCNQTCVLFLHKLFNRCLSTGLIPDVWNNIIINPIPKINMSDNRDPLCYRGISLAPAAYKLYCKLLNGRLSQWIGDNNGLADEQNGFRKGRSTVDQIASLSNIIDVR